jgi:hypothetical protein
MKSRADLTSRPGEDWVTETYETCLISSQSHRLLTGHKVNTEEKKYVSILSDPLGIGLHSLNF